MTVYRIAHQAFGLATIRLALALGGLGSALAAGAEQAPAVTGLAFGTGASALALISDRRSVLFRRPTVEVLPTGARTDGLGRATMRGLLPSTAGVTLLLAVSLAFEPILSAVLAGVLLGMALVTLQSWVDLVARERREGRAYHATAADPSRRFVSPR